MKKMKLELTDLQVESFPVEVEAASERGTVEGFATGEDIECQSLEDTGCGYHNTCDFICTWDHFCTWECTIGIGCVPDPA